MVAKEQEYFLNNIKAAIGLEREAETQKEIIETYLQQSNKIKPQLVTEPLPKEPEKPVYAPQKSFLVLIPGIIMFILGLICLLANANNQFEYLGIILLVFSIVAIVVTLLIDADTRSINKEKAKEYNEAYSHFEDEFSRIKRMNSLSKKKNQEETFAWSNQRKSDMAELNTALDNTEQLLKELYSLDFIYDKYRNLPALTSIYEYFITGRCDSLKGPHGAYNLYEDEVRKDTVISQLSTVLDHLEQVKQNQYMLYQQVKAMQENINNIGNEISTIRGYTGHIMDLSAVNAYYSALTAHNAEISATMHLLNG